jgi:hypothetical protein
MLIRKFPDPYTAWRGIIKELCYPPKSLEVVGAGGITTSYKDGVVVEIDNLLEGPELHLDMSSFGKNRWKTFLKRYLRPDYGQWVDDTVAGLGNLKKHQVAGYSVSYNPQFKEIGRKGYSSSSHGHRWGACLSAVQIQRFPNPLITVVSRASQLDKAGFLDLSLMYLTAKRSGWEKVSGRWIISMAFIAAVAQIFFVARFNQPLKGHSLEKSTRRFWLDDWRLAKYGPQKRSIKKAEEWRETGKIFRSCLVSELSLEFEA